MKEAAGEANMTVITIVLIAIVLGVGTIIVNRMMSSSETSSCCSANGGVWYGGACYAPNQCSADATTGQTVCTGTGSVSTDC